MLCIYWIITWICLTYTRDIPNWFISSRYPLQMTSTKFRYQSRYRLGVVYTCNIRRILQDPKDSACFAAECILCSNKNILAKVRSFQVVGFRQLKCLEVEYWIAYKYWLWTQCGGGDLAFQHEIPIIGLTNNRKNANNVTKDITMLITSQKT